MPSCSARNLPSPVAPQSDDETNADSKSGDNDDSTAPADAENSTEVTDDSSSTNSGTSDSTEKGAESKKKAEKPVTVTIDFENIGQRIVALPIPARNYTDLRAGKKGILYLLEGPQVINNGESTTFTLHRFDLEKRKTEMILDGIKAFALSANGGKMLYRKDKTFYIADSSKAPESGTGALKMDDMEVYVDPPAEWRQMYHEVWRIERDFFYDPHFHGLDLEAAESCLCAVPRPSGQPGRPERFVP